MDRNWGKGIPIITSDNKKGAQLIADQIIQAGCKKILTLEGKTYIHHPFEERGLSMKQILNKNGISVISAEVEWNVLSYEYYMWIVEKYLDLFDDVDAALMLHPDTKNSLGGRTLAIYPLRFEFFGQNAHACTPQNGKSALDAAVMSYMSINLLRQFAEPNTFIHGVIAHGGEAANVIPAYASLEYYFRGNRWNM